MSEQERIVYSGFSKEYVMQQFQFSLDKDIINDGKFDITLPLVNEIMIYQEKLMYQILKEKKGFTGIVIRSAYKLKNLIKRIPILKRIGVRLKNNLLKKAYSQLKTEEKDITQFLNLEINDFITIIYRMLLDREPDVDGFASFQAYLCQGAPREAMVYLVTLSKEFARRYNIKNLEKYKKIYKKYLIKSKIKKFPFIGWYILLHRLPNHLMELRIIENNMKIIQLRHEEEIKNLKEICRSLINETNIIKQDIDKIKSLKYR